MIAHINQSDWMIAREMLLELVERGKVHPNATRRFLTVIDSIDNVVNQVEIAYKNIFDYFQSRAYSI